MIFANIRNKILLVLTSIFTVLFALCLLLLLTSWSWSWSWVDFFISGRGEKTLRNSSASRSPDLANNIPGKTRPPWTVREVIYKTERRGFIAPCCCATSLDFRFSAVSKHCKPGVSLLRLPRAAVPHAESRYSIIGIDHVVYPRVGTSRVPPSTCPIDAILPVVLHRRCRIQSSVHSVVFDLLDSQHPTTNGCTEVHQLSKSFNSSVQLPTLVYLYV